MRLTERLEEAGKMYLLLADLKGAFDAVTETVGSNGEERNKPAVNGKYTENIRRNGLPSKKKTSTKAEVAVTEKKI